MGLKLQDNWPVWGQDNLVVASRKPDFCIFTLKVVDCHLHSMLAFFFLPSVPWPNILLLI